MFQRVIKYCADFLAFVAAVCLVLMMCQIVLDVALKYFFNTPIEGNLEVISVYYMVAVVFLPLAMVELRHEHISASLISGMLPKTTQNYVYIVGNMISAAFFGILAYQTFWDAVKSTRIKEVMMGTELITVWPSRWILPIGFLMILIAILLHAWRAYRNPRSFDPSPVSPEFSSSDQS